jgi:uncharacterized membrane protein YfcA
MKYIWIVLAALGAATGIYFAGDMLKASIAGVVTAVFLYLAYRAWLKRTEGK